ncbi:RimK family alpha-L-glutamate ligase [Herbidospora mongoliensis]|uniref:RimK family alpha-L-glutamate ligase n=1 Tax=Herbidospora mongoliensis TaxID=688067 RepID=UPI00082D8010|nr:RimK family alpha-L-glutamate ligase [Herbidospora mongoliensis]
MTTDARLAVLASRVRFEEKQIMAALDRRGVSFVHLDPRSLVVTDEAHFNEKVVLNREIGHYRALYAASALESAGAAVLNTAAATHVSGDKWLTTSALMAKGLPTPRTALAMTPEAAFDALDQIGYPAVVKPLVGSWGRLVTAIPDRATAVGILEHVAALPSPQQHIIYVQELVEKADRDIRVLVVGGEALGATYRRGDEWRTNVARGALSIRCELTNVHAKLAVAAAEAVGAEIAGVDLLEDDDGRLTVLEVNDRVEFRGFQEAHEIDVADVIASYAMARAEA